MSLTTKPPTGDSATRADASAAGAVRASGARTVAPEIGAALKLLGEEIAAAVRAIRGASAAPDTCRRSATTRDRPPARCSPGSARPPAPVQSPRPNSRPRSSARPRGRSRCWPAVRRMPAPRRRSHA